MSGYGYGAQAGLGYQVSPVLALQLGYLMQESTYYDFIENDETFLDEDLRLRTQGVSAGLTTTF